MQGKKSLQVKRSVSVLQGQNVNENCQLYRGAVKAKNLFSVPGCIHVIRKDLGQYEKGEFGFYFAVSCCLLESTSPD